MSEHIHHKPSAKMQLTLPSSWYIDNEIFLLEREHIFFREWLCVGREEDILLSGNYRILDIHGESVILLRNGEGQLRAFYNVCRHRGAQLCATSDSDVSQLKGGVSANAITCPYHAWTYDLNGQLIRARLLPDDCDFSIDDIQLYPIGVDSWDGFIFIHLTPESARPFTEHVKHVSDRFKRYRMQDLRVGKSLYYAVEANWKVICENYNECYHCGPVHPELCRIVPSFRESGGADLDWEDGIPHKDGAVTFTKSGTTNRRTIPGLNELEQTRHFGELIYPNTFLSLSSDHVAVFVLEPDGPCKTRVTCHFLFEPYEMAQPDFDPSDSVEFWDLVNRQDWAICERVQKGMSSRVHKQGFCAPMEDLTLDIRKYVTERIGSFVDTNEE
jgi:Rieske 2Fe-2S family protein